MPMENFHSCRLEDPAQFDSFRSKECAEKSDGKCINHVYGIFDEGGSKLQSLRYAKEVWTEDSARAHCRSRDGSFEPAKKAEGKTMKLNYRNQRNAAAIAAYWGKPLDRPDWYKIEALSEDEAEIMIYDVIGWPFNDAAELVRTLAEMKQKTIIVRINSPGGDVFDSNAIFNALQSHKAKIITRIEGLAASAASYVAAAGKVRQAYKNVMVMIHEPFAVAIADQYEMREIADVLGKISDGMVDMYADTTSVGKRELRDMMKAETWMTAKEALDKGFIDTIVDGKAVKAAFDLSMFAHTPDEFSAGARRAPTDRDLEKVLRDAGLSRSEAKALLAGRQQDPDADPPLAGRQPESATEELTEVAALITRTTSLYGRN